VKEEFMSNKYTCLKSFTLPVFIPLAALILAAAISAYSQAPSPVSNQSLSVPGANSYARGTVTGFPSGSFTVEGYVYFPSSAPSGTCMLLLKEGLCEASISSYTQSTYPYDTFYRFYFGKATGSAGQFAGPYCDVKDIFLRNSWHYIAMTYNSSSSTKRIFLDGAQLSESGTSTKTHGTPPSTDVVVGGVATSAYSFGYYVDELRVSSVVRYTTSFTPPVAPFSSDGTTAALWHFDDGQGATTFADSSPNGNTLLGYNGAGTAYANSTPVADPVSDTTDEDTAKTITLSGSDAETCDLTFSIVSNPSHGSLGGPTNNFTCVSGSPYRDTNTIVYTPTANYNGSDSFAYRVNDGRANSAMATVTITVNSVNDAPVLASISDRTVHAGSTLNITNSAVDPDVPPQSLVFSLTAAPVGASIGTNDGVFRWTPGDSHIATTNLVTVRVADNGTPSVDDAKSFLIAVVARPLIARATVSSNRLALTWTAISGSTYRVQFKDDLREAGWSDLVDVPATSAKASALDDMENGGATRPQRYYRIFVLD